MRRWILLGAPAMALMGLGMRAGGAAAGLGLWLTAGALMLPPGRYPYPRKRGGRPWRLFFAFAMSAAALGALYRGMCEIIPVYFAPSPYLEPLAAAAASLFSLPVCGRAYALPMPNKMAKGLGILLCLAALYFIGGR